MKYYIELLGRDGARSHDCFLTAYGIYNRAQCHAITFNDELSAKQYALNNSIVSKYPDHIITITSDRSCKCLDEVA